MLKNILIVLLIMATITIVYEYRNLQCCSVKWMEMYFDESNRVVDLEWKIDSLNALYK